MKLMEDPAIRRFDKILRIGVQVSILEKYILRSMRGRMKEVEYEAEVVEWGLLGSRTSS